MNIKILQFGEGNFLRGFIDWMVQRLHDRGLFDGGVKIIQPRAGDTLGAVGKILNAQNGSYHVCLRGLENGQTVERLEEIKVVQGVDLWTNLERYAVLPELRFVVSNTTEAGIQYLKGENTFPFKVFKLLKARFAAGRAGLVFLPCELVERNGELLKECVLKYIDDAGDAGLRAWVESECVFCSTLVDRIIAGKPDPESAGRYARQIGAPDEALVCGEPFHFLAVCPPQGYDLEKELPLRAAGLNVVYTADLQPYRTRKVRFLNATHTTMVYPGLEKGFTEVAQCLEDQEFNKFVRQVVFEEIFPTVSLPDAEKREFAATVLERFANPFAHHQLQSIALNTLAKWKTRCLPVISDYYRIFGTFPEAMMLGYDAIARHYDNAK